MFQKISVRFTIPSSFMPQVLIAVALIILRSIKPSESSLASSPLSINYSKLIYTTACHMLPPCPCSLNRRTQRNPPRDDFIRDAPVRPRASAGASWVSPPSDLAEVKAFLQDQWTYEAPDGSLLVNHQSGTKTMKVTMVVE